MIDNSKCVEFHSVFSETGLFFAIRINEIWPNILEEFQDFSLRIDYCDAWPFCSAHIKLIYLFSSLSYQSLSSIIE